MKTATKRRAQPSALSQMQLAEWAFRLVPHDDEAPAQLVLRAMNIWNAAGELLAQHQGRANAKATITFKEVADQKVLPSTRRKTEVVGTTKGVEQAVERFFDGVLDSYDRAMNGRIVTGSVLSDNKQAVKKLRDDVLAKRELSANQLEQLRQFQIQSGNKSFAVSVDTIRALLPGADVGQPGLDL